MSTTLTTPASAATGRGMAAVWRRIADARWTAASVLTLIGLWALASWFLPTAVLPSPWMRTASPASMADSQRGITAAYAPSGSWRGPALPLKAAGST